MSNKLILPFSKNNKTNKTFKILNEKQLKKISLQKGMGLLDIIKKTLIQNNNNTDKNDNNDKLSFVKASDSKEYYKKIKNNKLGGGYLKDVLFPSGLSGATTVLGLVALQHAIVKNEKKIKSKVVKSKKVKSKK